MTKNHDNDAHSEKQMNPTDAETDNGKEMRNMTVALGLERIEAQSTITSKGQITFPAKLMRKLGLKEGDLLRFIYEGGELHVEPISLLSADELFGALDRPEDKGNFVLDIEAAKEERTQSILTKYPKNFGGD